MILSYDLKYPHGTNIEMLNGYLANGYRFVSATPFSMNGNIENNETALLVILEK